jgi:Mg2+ and Co2+ transporter CorA
MLINCAAYVDGIKLADFRVAVAIAFAGIWGMNFKSIPELPREYGDPAALLFITAVCGVFFYRFKHSGRF